MSSRQLVSQTRFLAAAKLMVPTVLSFLLVAVFVGQGNLIAQQPIYYPQSAVSQGFGQVPPPVPQQIAQPIVPVATPVITRQQLSQPRIQQPQAFPRIAQPLVPVATPVIRRQQLTQPQIQQPQALPQQIAQPTNLRPNLVPGSIVERIQPATPSDLSLQATKEPTAEEVADDISSIRKQLGGGLSEHFGELTKTRPDWKKMVEDGFQNEVNRLAAEQASRETAAAQDPSSPIPPIEALPTQSATGGGTPFILLPPTADPPRLGSYGPPRNWNQSNRTNERVAARSYAPVASSPNQAEQLRIAARTLDQMAGQFENTGLYAEADQVRAQAQRFWIQSRQFKSGEASR